MAALEFALLLPVMLLLAAGSVETGALLSAYDAADRLAAQFAASYADCSDTSVGVCQAELALYTAPATIGNVAPQLTASNLSLQMLQVKMNGTVPGVTYSYPAGATLTAGQVATAQATIPNGETGVLVSLSYRYTLMFFQNVMAPFFGSQITIAYTVAQLKS